MLITGLGKRSLPKWCDRGGKGLARAGLASLAVALCLAGLTGTASAAPPPAGFALAWGWNSYGQLGDGTTADASLPVRVHLPAGTRVTAVAAGTYDGLAVTSAGRVLAWGANYLGQLGVGTTFNGSRTPVRVHLPVGSHVTAVAGGTNHGLALTSDGRVLAWGDNEFGQLGTGGTASSDVPVPVHLPAGTRVTAIAAGSVYSLALTSDDRVLSWGENLFGELGNGTNTDSSLPVPVHLPAGVRATAIAAGDYHGLALTSDGRVLDWGGNIGGQLGDGTTADSTTPVWVRLPPDARVTAVAGGGANSLAVTCDGRVLAWGANDAGELGDGSTGGSSTTPVWVRLPSGTRVDAVAAGSSHGLARTSDGRLLAWGYNGTGQLGNGTATDSSVPVLTHLPWGTHVTAITGGTGFSLALT